MGGWEAGRTGVPLIHCSGGRTEEPTDGKRRFREG